MNKIHQKQFLDFFYKTQINFFAPAFAYYMFLFLLPAILVVGSISSFFNIDHDWIITVARQSLPKTVENIVVPIIKGILNGQSLAFVTVAILFSLWILSSIAGIIRQTFNHIYDTKEKINDFFSRIFGLFWFTIIFAGFSVFLVIALFGNQFISKILQNNAFSLPLIWFLFFGIYIMIFLMNFLLPVTKPDFRSNLVGSLLEMFLFLILNKSFNYYALSALERYSFFTAFSSLIVVLIYLNLIGVIIAMGHVVIAWLQTFNFFQNNN
jgi:membrane protein